MKSEKYARIAIDRDLGGRMSQLLDDISNATRAALCEVWDAVEGALSYTFGVPAGSEMGESGFPAIAKSLVCGVDPAPIPAPPPPITGGQCDCGDYFLFVTILPKFVDGSPGAPYELIFRLWGPVGGAVFEPLEVQPDPEAVEPVQRLVVDCKGDPNVEACRPASFKKVLLGGIRGAVQSQRVERIGGLPDNCGDPVRKLPPAPPGWGNFSRDMPIGGPGSGVTVPIVGVVGVAYFDVNANVQIPINVDVGGVTFEVNFNASTGGVSIRPPGTGRMGSGDRSEDLLGTGGPPTPIPPEYPPLPPGTDADGDGRVDGRDVIVGAIVTVTNPGNTGVLLQDQNPDVGIPDFGLIQFQCAVPGGRGAWTSDIKVKNRLHIIPCPWPYGAAAVRGTPRNGVTWTIEPLYDRRRLAQGLGAILGG